jgi:cell division septation protein DedD
MQTQQQDETQDQLLLEDEETGELTRLVPLPGFGIALASFVPAFLMIFFGIPYLAGSPVASRVPVSLLRSTPPVVSPLSPEKGFVGAPPQEPAPMPSETPTKKASGPAAVPSPTLATPRPASPPTRPHVEPETAKPERSASTVTKDPAWVRGAAFSDRDSAERLAASVEQQGYPAKVRRDDTSVTPWVVWIGQHPGGMSPSERRK